MKKLKLEKTNLEKRLYDVNSAILTHKANLEKYNNLQREYNLLNSQLSAYLQEKQVTKTKI